MPYHLDAVLAAETNERLVFDALDAEMRRALELIANVGHPACTTPPEGGRPPERQAHQRGRLKTGTCSIGTPMLFATRVMRDQVACTVPPVET